MVSKSSLAIELSKLKVFNQANVSLEQYPTDSEIAATILWQAKMNNDIEDKIIADLGAGTGILGIGALLLGADYVYFVEKDEKAIEILKENLNNLNIEDNFKIINLDIQDFDKKVDLVIQNPPFGTKEKHADKLFLEKAFEITSKIYSFHKTSTKVFIEKISKDHNFKIKEQINFKFPLKATQKFHKKRIENIDVSCFKLILQS
jgi:putative methylase